jgi:succinate-acetate transporter protein
MGPPMGSASSSGAPGGSMMASGWASPAILGFMVFGIATIMLGLLFLPKPYGGSYAGIAPGIFYLGYAVALVLGFVGLISIIEGHQYWGTVFLGYAAFWGAYSYAFIHGGFANGFGLAGYSFVWLLFTVTFLISSFKHGWGTFFSFLFLAIAFILLVVGFWDSGSAFNLGKISSGQLWATGGWWIFTGAVWWYNGTAQLTHHTYGKKILPY